MSLFAAHITLAWAEVCTLALVCCFLGCAAVIVLLEKRWRRGQVSPRPIHRDPRLLEKAPGSDLISLLEQMREHRLRGDFSRSVTLDPHSEVGQIAVEYNRVLERVTSEIAQRELAEQQYRSIFDNAIEGIFQTTVDGQYLHANLALARIYGFTSVKDLMAGLTNIGRQLYVDPQRRNEFVGLLETHDVITDFQSEVYRSDGSVIWISENARARRDVDGTLLYYEGSVEDITQRRSSDRLLQDVREAEAANRAKSDFLASMSHEIRTPLNGVIGMLDLLASTALTPQQSRYGEIARSSANVLLSLINDILDFSKAESGRLEIEHIAFDLRQLVEDVPEMFHHAAEQKQVTLSCRFADSMPQTVRGDSERLRQVLVNLVGNAIKFTPQGNVTIQVTGENLDPQTGRSTVRFAVTDTGIGIPTERRHRLFQAFSQVDASTTRRFGGTGLGLAICRQLVEAMGGRIAVESCVGEGSTFWFELPMEVLSGPARLPGGAKGELSQYSALILDDNLTNLEILRDQLTLWGLRIEACSCHERALAALRAAAERSSPFDIAILDGQLPTIGGLEVADEIRHDPQLADTRLLLLTSHDRGLEADRVETLQLTVLHKPVRQSRLFEALLTLTTADGDLKHTTREPAPRTLTPSRPRGRVLIVDDNEINRIVAEEIVLAAGHQPTLACGGHEAIEALRTSQFDLVLMDCEMPELDGWTATREIRRLEAAGELPLQAAGPLRIVALTAHAVTGDHEECMMAGMNDYLTKPIDRRKLLAVLDGIRPAAVPVAMPEKRREYVDAPPMSASLDQPIDVTDLTDRCGNKPEFVARVLSRFRDDVARRRVGLTSGDVVADFNHLAYEAHAIKGAAANVSARTVSAAADALEQGARSGQVETCRDAERRLQEALDLCLGQIEQLLSDSPAANTTGTPAWQS